MDPDDPNFIKYDPATYLGGVLVIFLIAFVGYQAVDALIKMYSHDYTLK